MDTQFDSLLWCKVNSSKYPILSQIARDVLAIPVSTVASESAFSTGGRILDEYKSSMTPDMVEALILTQNWLWSSLFMDATTNLQVLVDENEFMDALAEGIIYNYFMIMLWRHFSYLSFELFNFKSFCFM